MGGGGGMDDHECDPPPKRTLVLVGRTGNGKSATGNSILGKAAFKSARQLSGVTDTCELHETTMTDRRVVVVIDTPGLFDPDAQKKISIPKEIIKCIDMAKDGIHAVLVVLSTSCRFSAEEDMTIRDLQKLFGDKISNYMIVVFTGGDDVPSFSDYLENGCPDKLKNFISLCGDRVVLFDNKTTDENKKAQQVGELLSLVDGVLLQNDGQPFTNEYFMELKNGAMMSDENEDLNSSEGQHRTDFLKAHQEMIERMTERIELKLKEETAALKKQLEEEQAARQRASQMASEAQTISSDEIKRMKETFAREAEDLRRRVDDKCSIL